MPRHHDHHQVYAFCDDSLGIGRPYYRLNLLRHAITIWCDDSPGKDRHSYREKGHLYGREHIYHQSFFSRILRRMDERFPAPRANEIIVGLAVHLIAVAVPPGIATLVWTEQFDFASGCLNNGHTTGFANVSDVGGEATEPVSLAISFNRVFVHTRELTDSLISVSFPAELCDSASLCIRHFTISYSIQTPVRKAWECLGPQQNPRSEDS